MSIQEILLYLGHLHFFASIALTEVSPRQAQETLHFDFSFKATHDAITIHTRKDYHYQIYNICNIS